MYTLVNLLASMLALDSIGRTLASAGLTGASLAVDNLTAEMLDACNKGYITITPDASADITLGEDAEQQFDLLRAYAPSTLVILNGKLLELTTDYTWAEGGTQLNLVADTWLDGDEIWLVDTTSSGLTLTPASVSGDRLTQAVQDEFVNAAWGDVTDIDATNKKARLQLKDLDGTNLSLSVPLRFTCDADATMSIASGGGGTILAGSENDMIIKTSATGRVDLQITTEESKVISVAFGATQGSPIVDCRETIDFDFSE